MKTKNKKLLALLFLPVIIAAMVLPLCSFTTTTATPGTYTIYQSRTRCDLSYKYHRVTNTAEYDYYGTIPSANRVLIGDEAMASNKIDTIRGSVQFYSSDLLVTGTKSIDIMSFGSSSDLKSKLTKDMYLSLTYKSDDTTVSTLGDFFYFWDYNFYDNIQIELFDHEYLPIDYAVNPIDCFATVQAVKYNYATYSFEKVTYNVEEALSSYLSPDVSSGVYVVVNDIVNGVLSENGKSASDFVEISSVELMLNYKDPVSDSYLGFGAVRLSSYISPLDSFNVYDQDLYDFIHQLEENAYQRGEEVGYDQGLTYGEAAGYQDGYNAGLSAGGGGSGSYDQAALDAKYSEGYQAGYKVGHENGSKLNNEELYETAWNAGYDEAVSDLSSSQEQAYNNGYSVGYNAGYDAGVLVGSSGSYNDGYVSGRNDGYDEGLDIGYGNGYAVGLEDGYEKGRIDGYNEGSTAIGNVFGDLSTFLEVSVGGFLNTPLWSNFSLGALLSLVVSVTLLLAFIKIFGG